jgi:ribonuclease VapC
MVIDSSALIAILSDEPERKRFNELIAADTRRLISTATLLETAMVIESRYGESGGRELDLFIEKAGIEIIDFTVDQMTIARQAFQRFGKGRHAACLNYGDCFSYALSRVSGEPLLFKGHDFPQTDAACVVF